MYTVHGREADLSFFMRFGHGPILVQICSIVKSNSTAYALALFT